MRAILAAVMLALVVLAGCFGGGGEDGDGSDGGGGDAMAWEGGAADAYPRLQNGSPDVIALQSDIPDIAAWLRAAGDDPTQAVRHEWDRAAAAANAQEAAGDLPRPRAFPAMYTLPGLDCDVPAFHPDRYDVFDAAVEDLMSDWGILGATFAVSNECATFYDQGYGQMGPWFIRNAPVSWTPPLFGPPVPDDALVRIASVTKPITAAAIHFLDEDGDLDKDDFAICVPGGPSNCILDLDLPNNFDARIGDITVRQLVGHAGGFDRGTTNDYLFRAWEVYQASNLNAPPTATDFAEYMLALGLDYDPGVPNQAQDSYSNLGYLILQLVIEEASGMDYLDYVQERIMTQLDIGPDDIVQSNTKRLQRDARELGYWCIANNFGSNQPVSTFPGEEGDTVCWANGGYVLEPMLAHGGLSMTAAAVATFYAHWWNQGTPRDTTPADYWAFPNPDATAFSHNGLLAATATIASRCTNGLNVVLLTNQHAWGDFDFDDATERLCGAADDFLAQGPYYAVLWVADDPAGWVSHRGTHEDDYQARFDELSDLGLRANDVNGYAAFGDTYYSHTWINDGSDVGWAATHGHDGAGFIERFEELADEGYRLDRISCWNDDGTLRYASVWRESGGIGWFGYIGLTGAEYQAKFEEHGAAGFRLLSVDGCDLGSESRYAGAWVFDATSVRGNIVPNTAYRGIHGVDGATYQDFFDDGVADGLRLTDFDVWTVGGQPRYAAVMTADGGPAFFHQSKWSFYDFQPKWQDKVDDGWRLASTVGWGPSP
jgi:CubicO group peptidase (beta-lactamase class C family)